MINPKLKIQNIQVLGFEFWICLELRVSDLRFK